MSRRKKNLFAAADLNDDKKLSKDELADFLHPGVYIDTQYYPHLNCYSKLLVQTASLTFMVIARQ